MVGLGDSLANKRDRRMVVKIYETSTGPKIGRYPVETVEGVPYACFGDERIPLIANGGSRKGSYHPADPSDVAKLRGDQRISPSSLPIL